MKPTFGQLLRSARKTADVTIPQVAEHLGLSTGHISNVERGTAAPLADDKIIALGPLLKVNPNYLRARASDERAIHRRARRLATLLKERYMSMPEHVQGALALLIEGDYTV